MKLGSDGLGKTIVTGEVVRVKKVDDLVIFFANTTMPVRWQTRMGFQEEDLRALVFALLRPSNMLFVFKALLLFLIRALFSEKSEISAKETLDEKEAR